MKVSKPFDRLDYIYKLLMISALVILGTVLAADIVIPILVSALLAIVLLPIVNWLEKKLPTTFAVIIVLTVSFVVFGGFIWIIGQQITNLVRDLPNLETKYFQLVETISNQFESLLGITGDEQTQMVKDSLKGITGAVTNVLVSTTNTLSLIVQIPIYIFLFLIYRDKFKKFLDSLLPNDEGQEWKSDIENVLQGYISGLLIVTAIISVLNTVGLLLLGIEHAVFFGVLSGILTIIPYVGIFIGATLPVLFALLTKDSAWYAVGVVIMFTVVQFTEGNFITPRITGSKVSINALAAIVALLVGAKILGVAGMILAVPLMGVIKVLLNHSDHLKSFTILLDDTDDDEKGKSIIRIRRKPKAKEA